MFAKALSDVGRYSLPIYLTHFLPVAAVRVVLMRVGVDQPVLLYAACIAGSVAFGILADEAARRTPLAFLFERPRWASLTKRGRKLPQQAEAA